jgi:hypothetical protein
MNKNPNMKLKNQMKRENQEFRQDMACIATGNFKILKRPAFQKTISLQYSSGTKHCYVP